MKKLKFRLFWISAFMLMFASCTDDMNVQVEDDDLFGSDEFFANPGSYRQAMAGVYGNLSLTGTSGAESSFLQGIDAGTSQFGRCWWYLQNLTTEEAIWSYENDAGAREINRNTWNSENPIILGMFSRTMAEVALVNEFLRQSTDAKLDSRGHNDSALRAEVAFFRTEARALRAYAYYVMMDLFGKAPFITENDPLNFSGPQYDRAQLFAFIEQELLEVLPDLKPARSNEYGRVDQAFANMILAKMYLNAEVYIGQNRYADCITQLNNVLTAGYQLEPNYLDNFKADNHTSTEMIFTLQSDGLVTQNYGATTVMINGSVGSIEQNGTSLGVSAGAWGGALRVRKQFVEKWEGPDFTNDQRNTIISGERPVDIANIADRDQGYIIAKFSNISSLGVPGPNTTFVDTDFPLFRLGDAYLMYVEAVLRGGGGSMPDALAYFNALRERANGGSTSANIIEGELTLDLVLDERLRELHWEGHRRQDLIRFNRYTGGNYNWAWKGGGMNGIALPSTMRVFPVPAAAISANPNLTQNPGY